MNAPGLAVLDGMIGKLRALPKQLPALTSARAVGPIEAAIKAQISAGTDPDGKPWAPTKKGTRPESHADGAIKVSTVGADTIVAVLTGHHVFQHFGWDKVKPRPIIPNRADGTPEAWKKALKLAASDSFARIMGSA